MRLNNSQIKRIIHNSLGYDNCEDVQLNRFLPKQYDICKNEFNEWMIRAKTSAGIVIDFISDTNYFKMEFVLKDGGSGDFGCIDAYVDGIMVDHQHFSVFECLYAIKLDGKKHRISIYLPWSFEFTIRNIHIQDGAYIKQVKKKYKILCVGDSITQGFISEFPSIAFSTMLYRNLDAEVINQGVGGYYFSKDSICEELSKYDFDLVIVAYGTNDYAQVEEKEKFINMATSYVDKLVEVFPKEKILGIIPIYRTDKDYHNYVRNIYRDYSFDESKQIIKRIYKEKNIKTIDEVYIPHCDEFYAPDGIHPNELGYTFYGSTVIEIASNMIKK